MITKGMKQRKTATRRKMKKCPFLMSVALLLFLVHLVMVSVLWVGRTFFYGGYKMFSRLLKKISIA